jgi:hypothetical protein
MSFKLTPAENLQRLQRWHGQHHMNLPWASCPHEPCSILEPDFRKAWNQ